MQVSQKDATEENSTDYFCNICKDKGVVLIDKESDIYGRCECFKKYKSLKFSKITPEFKEKSFETFKPDKPETKRALNCAKTYLKDFEEIKKDRSNSIMLTGRPGTGKTHLLMALTNQLISENQVVIYFPFVEGFNDLKDNFEELNTKLERMKTVDVLFIDDLFKGRVRPTDWQLEQIFGIVNYRYLNRLPLLISSEKNIDEMCEFDEAIGSRIYEMAKNYYVNIRGDINYNYRLKPKGQTP